MSALSSQIRQSGSQYTDKQRRAVVTQYAIDGNQALVSRKMGIPKVTVHDWVNSDWGIDLIKSIRIENEQEFIIGYTNIIRANLSAQSERLEHGDVIGRDPDGNELRQRVRYRDLVVGAGIAVDKLRLLSNQATSITASDSRLDDIARQLEAYNNDQQAKVIEHGSSNGDKDTVSD